MKPDGDTRCLVDVSGERLAVAELLLELLREPI